MSDAKKEPKGKAKGGLARANSLTKEQRSEIAKKAAAKRWGYKATHMGNFKEQFGIDAECYVLDDGKKTPVVTKTGLAELLGIGEHARDIDQLLNAQYMSNFRDLELLEKMENPFKFQLTSKSKTVHQAYGYDITVIVDIGRALIAARDAGALPAARVKAADSAQRIINASAKSGIRDVAYAVSGYEPSAQEVIEAFKMYVREEARAWEKEFPDELYYEWYRLYELKRPERGHPGNFRWFTERHIYETLAKSEGKILDLAKESREENGKRGDKIHMFLSDVGVKALRRHIGKIIGMASMCETKEQYESALERVFK
ncbi:P63C domain-containing protein [Cronobacter sakazakii]|uniref:P63C domain-containing protein n=1 Tax=Cronobacter sakazakii TaxID=28141 RepID=UPI00097629F8|nr:P63C domain-containing protein [Cronobacter sakazakii]EKY2079385.1 hypothetical protein [Cronobacter sakazakii]ELY4207594.1 hypothetical protein [Cronobacter sakazakii]KAB1480529.1 hypothetical protein AUM88_01330 [Cronobacter sakazakii]MDK1059065.1 P63C domain-containing protein [Cronobacter sakazakii]MDT3523240.1 P63C domain-containing protein [Cronobacter sakazakii]